MKRCRDCGVIKPLTDYYKSSRTPDGKQYICKICSRYRATRSKEPKSTVRVRRLLEARGIPTVTGIAAGFHHIDLAAWGCVPVEAKGSNKQKYGGYGFTLSPKQKAGLILQSIVVLLCWNNGRERVFVVPGTSSVFRHQKKGTILSAANISLDGKPTPGRWSEWRQYENAYSHLFDAFDGWQSEHNVRA